MLKKAVTYMSGQMKWNDKLVVIWTTTGKKVCVSKRTRILSYQASTHRHLH